MAVYEQGEQVTLNLTINDTSNNPVDPDGYPATEPTVAVKDVFGEIQQAASLATRVSKGNYSFTYDLDQNATTGYWAFEWMFTVAGLVIPLNDRTERFAVSRPGTATYDIENLISILRLRLKDNHPDYRKQRWNDEELRVFIQNSLWDINVSPPATTYFFVDDYYNSVPDWKSLIIDGAMIFALIAQGIFEIGKEFSYSDNGISITIDRSSKYQSFFNALAQAYELRKTLVKKNYFMKAVIPQVVKSGELEQRLRTYAPSQYRIR